MNLSNNVLISRVGAAVAVGTTASNGTLIDMQGHEGVLGVLLANTITDGGLSLKARGGNASDGSDLADLDGAIATTDNTGDGKTLILDVYRPNYRYIEFVAVRGGATGAILDGMLAVLYDARVLPETPDATNAATVLAISPYPAS